MTRHRIAIRHTLRTLSSRNYRLFFTGQGVSLIGTWMQRIAMSWLVYRLTDSVFLLGMVGFLGQIPTFLLGPFAGVLADRLNRHRIIVVTQILSMLQALALAVLVMTGAVQVWHIIVLSIFLGLVNALDMPTRQAFVVEMIEKREDLVNAIALNSAIFNGARLIGPSIAGILIATVGEGVCFLLNGLSYIAVIAALLAMRLRKREIERRSENMLHEIREGFTYALGLAPIRSVLLLLGLVSVVGMPYTVLMPVFARDILHGGPHTLGFLMAATGCGALVGAIYLASRRSVLGVEKNIPVAAGIFGVGLVGFSLSRALPVSLALMLVTGFGMMVQMASSNTLLQTVVDDNKRGRVMSFYNMAFMGMAPFGSLLAGSVARKIGAPYTLLIGGVCCLAGAGLIARQLPVLGEGVRKAHARSRVAQRLPGQFEAEAELAKPPGA
ncbi:MAG: MFS transporter [Candidatus Eisenbacteria bacterium]